MPKASVQWLANRLTMFRGSGHNQGMSKLPPGPRVPRLFQMSQMKIVPARLLSRLSLRSDGGQTVRVVRRGITFAPSGGVPVISSMN